MFYMSFIIRVGVNYWEGLVTEDVSINKNFMIGNVIHFLLYI